MARALILVIVIVLCPGVSNAHHAFAADYEKGNEGTITGTVTEVMFRNPHARYYLEVRGEDGSAELWDLETLNLMMLGRMGWKKDTIKVGDEITVTGILGRNNTRRMSIVTVTLPGGRTISPFRSNTQTNVELNADDADADDDKPWISRAAGVSPGLYELDEEHAYITFSYSHMGLSHPVVHFKDFEARLDLDGRTLAESSVTVTIDAASIDSGVAALDREFTGDAFFDVGRYPNITFASTALEEVSETAARLSGDLTVLGTTRPVVLDVEINDASMNRMTRKEMIGFSASGTIRRSDFGLTAYSDLVGDELRLNIQVEFVRANEQPGATGGAR
jgi:polyisoprenoid-binding protein YceI